MSISVEDAILAAIDEQQSRGLNKSAGWLSELALSATQAFLSSSMNPPQISAPPAPMSRKDAFRHRQAVSLLASQEYSRCYLLLEKSSMQSEESGSGGGQAAHASRSIAAALHPKLLFVACYAQYLAGEKAGSVDQAAKKNAANMARGGAQQQFSAGIVGADNNNGDVVAHPAASQQAQPTRSAKLNPHRAELAEVLSEALEHHPEDAYLLWLNGLVLRAQGSAREATAHFIAAVTVEPLLRCAWEDLAACTTGAGQLAEAQTAIMDSVPTAAAAETEGVYAIGDTFMLDIFTASVQSQFLSLPSDIVAEWQSLQAHFPTSPYIHAQLGSALSFARDFDGCRKHFEVVQQLDSHRLEGMDQYSNALFVKREKLALGLLAQHCYAVDPFRPESNVVAGNYYAIVRRHDRSLQHFKRAVAIDPTVVSAWTLMGHEYLEAKNTNAAVAAYRHAIAVSPSDYRPWYGLGQIYELLQVYHYALHYYWQTTSLRPNDPRMWAAVAGCLERQERIAESFACLERAEQCYRTNDDESAPLRLRRLAQYHRSLPKNAGEQKALVFYEKLIQCEFATDADKVEALPFLVERYTRRARNWLSLNAAGWASGVSPAALLPAQQVHGTPRHQAVLHANNPSATPSASAQPPSSAYTPAASTIKTRQDALGDLHIAETHLKELQNIIAEATGSEADPSPRHVDPGSASRHSSSSMAPQQGFSSRDNRSHTPEEEPALAVMGDQGKVPSSSTMAAADVEGGAPAIASMMLDINSVVNAVTNPTGQGGNTQQRAAAFANFNLDQAVSTAERLAVEVSTVRSFAASQQAGGAEATLNTPAPMQPFQRQF